MTIAEQLIRNIAQRPSANRLAVLNVLLNANNALSHAEISNALSNHGGIDRVTLYRVLDWLVKHGLSHRVASEDYVWLFQATHESFHQHAHFQCTICNKVYCLPEAKLPLSNILPENFKAESINFNIKGACANCVNSIA